MRPLWGLKPRDGRPWPLDLEALRRPKGRYHRRRRLLAVGVAAPVLALTVVAAAIAAYPGFDNATQYLSELGGATASAPMIFNAGVFVAGVMAGLAGIGFGLAIYALTGARTAAWVIGVVFILAGGGMAASTLYPWPDPRHMVINLALGIQLAPLLLLWGLAARRDLPPPQARGAHAVAARAACHDGDLATGRVEARPKSSAQQRDAPRLRVAVLMTKTSQTSRCCGPDLGGPMHARAK